MIYKDFGYLGFGEKVFVISFLFPPTRPAITSLCSDDKQLMKNPREVFC